MMAALGSAAAAIAAAEKATPTMNSGIYTIDPSSLLPGTHPADPAKHRGQFFELLGPAKTGHYGDVNWHTETMPLPDDIVSKFDGKVMAVTGCELRPFSYPFCPS